MSSPRRYVTRRVRHERHDGTWSLEARASAGIRVVDMSVLVSAKKCSLAEELQ